MKSFKNLESLQDSPQQFWTEAGRGAKVNEVCPTYKRWSVPNPIPLDWLSYDRGILRRERPHPLECGERKSKTKKLDTKIRISHHVEERDRRKLVWRSPRRRWHQ
jgi:hypothetical protein